MDNCSQQTSELAFRLIDQFPVLDWSAGYGRLGLRGRLGYENQQVRVHGRVFQHSVSAHAPSGVRFLLPPGDGKLRCEVALNDDVAARRTSADFVVLADNRVLAVEAGVRPGEPARKLIARLQGPCTLSLRVETCHRDYCHSVWLDPRWENQTTSPEAPWRDALGRVEVLEGQRDFQTDKAIITLVTPGYARLLDQLLGSLAAHGRCRGAVRFVFAVEPDSNCEAVIARHGATMVRCRRLGPRNQTLKAVLYSAASLIEARQYLCLDADTLVLEGVEPLFDCLEALPPQSVLVAKDAFLRTGPLGDQLTRHYAGRDADLSWLIGALEDEANYPLVVNDGVFASSRRGLLALESLLRSWPNAIAWMDQLHDHGWRNQFLFNLALARLRCGVELDETFNLQMHVHDALWQQRREGKIRATWRGRRVCVLHFCGWGRGKYIRWRQGVISGNADFDRLQQSSQ